MKSFSRALLPAVAIALALGTSGCSNRNDEVSARSERPRYHGGYGSRGQVHHVGRAACQRHDFDLRSPYSGEPYCSAPRCRR